MGAELRVRLAEDHDPFVAADATFSWRTEGTDWQRFHAAAHYPPTNDLVNRLSQAMRAGSGRALRHRGIDLWQFLPSFIWPEVHRARELAVALGALVDEVAPSRLVVVVDVGGPSARIWQGVARGVASARSLPLRVDRRLGGPLDRKRLLLERPGLPEVELVARRLRASAGARHRAGPAAGRHLLYATLARHAQPEPFGDRLWDEQISPLLEPLRASGWTVTGVDCPYSSRRAAAAAGDQRRREVPDVRWADFEAWLPRIPAFRRRSRAWLGDETFRAALAEDGVSLLWALQPTLRRAADVLAAECADLLDAAGRILDDVAPTALAATYETGPYARALLIEAARRGIPTIGLQHGMVFDNHYDYMHDQVVPGGTGERGFAVPDVTAVWSDYWRDVLTGPGSYPEGAVVATGNWRHDRERPGSGEVRATLGIGDGRPIVTVLPGWPGPVDFLDRCLGPCRAVGAHVVVKAHPADDPQEMRELLDRRGLPDALVLDRLSPALVVADVVVSGVSTAVAEAMLYDCPVVLFAGVERETVPFYMETGACIQVDDGPALEAALRSLVGEGEGPRDALRSAGRAAARRLFGPLDGRSGQRVVDVLDALVRRSEPMVGTDEAERADVDVPHREGGDG